MNELISVLGPRPHRRVGNGGPGSLGCVDCWRRIMTAPMTPDGWPAACSARWMPCGFSSASPVWTRPTSGPREPGGVVCPGAQPVSGDGKHQGAALSGTDPVAQSDLPSPRQSHLHRAGGRRQPFFLWPTTRSLLDQRGGEHTRVFEENSTRRLRALGLMLTCALGLLVAPLTAEAQQPTHVHRLGGLHPGLSRPAPHPSLEAFRQGLRELGYVEGQHLVLAYRFAEGRDEGVADCAAELVQRQVDVIIAGGPAAIRATQHATRPLPIVMAGHPDPVAQGVVTSLARPGGNTTGLSRLSAELPGKRLERRTATGPQRRRVAGLANPAAVSSTLYRHNLTVAAQALGLPLHVGELRRPDALDAACAAITRAGAAALIVRADPALLALLHGRLADLAATRRLPAMYDWGEYGAAGGLMSEAPSLSDVYRRAAIYGDKIRKGTKPADLPVAQPTKCELVLNRTTAKALGCTCPPAILFQADEVSRSRPPRSSCSSPSAFSRPPSPLQRSHRARAPGAAPWRRFPHPPLCGRRSWTGCGSAGRAQGGTSSSSADSRTATRSASRRSPPNWSSSGSIASLRSQHPPLSPPRTRPRRCRSACRRRSIPWAQG